MIQAPGGRNEGGDDYAHGGWTAPYRSAAGGEAVAEAQGSSFDLLLGRRTYDIFAAYWPKAGNGPLANGLNAATKYVATHRPDSLGWCPVGDLGADIMEGVRGVKSKDGPDLIVWGSSTLTSVLLEQGLVDEVLLLVYPVLLGRGKRFFSDSADPRELALVSTKALSSGVLINTFDTLDRCEPNLSPTRAAERAPKFQKQMKPVKVAALTHRRRCFLEAAHQGRERSGAFQRTRHANHFNRASQADDQINMMRRETRVGARSQALRAETRVVRDFTADGLRQLRSRLEHHIGPGFAPGVVGLAAHGPDVETFVLGKMAFGSGADMRRDTTFRIASMTKAITAAAVLMLVEEGKFRVDEPVDRLLPELANRRVLRRLDVDVDDTVSVKRPITVEDLLTFRCGLGMVVAPPGRYPIQKAIADLGINGVGFGPPDADLPLDGNGWMRKISSLPLFAQPGEDWLYTAGSNIQGVLVERASGRPLSRFFEERIFGPLGMKDTAFFVPPSKIDRLAHAYRSQDRALVVSDQPATGKWSPPSAFEQGDAGSVSTVDDYLAFARMLLAEGRYRGQSLLAPASVKAMTTNHLTAPQRAGGEMILGRGRGWGYGVSVVMDTIPGQPAPGSFGWIGGVGSSWISDPSKDLTMILMSQHEFASASGDSIYQEFQDDAYRALR